MTLTVSVSDLRNNISNYLEKVMKGTRVLVRDEKRDITIAEIVHTSSFDKVTYEKALQKAAGIFSEENHPEWKTKEDITDWVSKSRLSDQRSF
jgi:antitoxin (DNA-binding transcriptional repressor) of toxin-antitoxin stability system